MRARERCAFEGTQCHFRTLSREIQKYFNGRTGNPRIDFGVRAVGNLLSQQLRSPTSSCGEIHGVIPASPGDHWLFLLIFRPLGVPDTITTDNGPLWVPLNSSFYLLPCYFISVKKWQEEKYLTGIRFMEQTCLQRSVMLTRRYVCVRRSGC